MSARLALIGVGLIGGSYALALKQAGKLGSVVGCGRSRANLDWGLAHGVLDAIADSPSQAVRGADIVMLAVPAGQVESVLAGIAADVPAHALLTDAASTKQNVVAAARAHLGPHLPRFVPGHPIAGTENSGAAAARADLYQGRRVVLTPLPETESAALHEVRALWQACGARVAEMEAAEHDAVFAAVSHLPHLLSYAYMDMIAARADSALCLDYAASGFRDFTRIAASSPEMWRDIALANRTALLSEFGRFEEHWRTLRDALEKGDGTALEMIFARARNTRKDWSL